MAVVRDPTIFSVSVDGEHDRSVIAVEGALDSFNAGTLRDGFGRTLGRRAVIIDIRGVPFVDSAGLRRTR